MDLADHNLNCRFGLKGAGQNTEKSLLVRRIDLQLLAQARELLQNLDQSTLGNVFHCFIQREVVPAKSLPILRTGTSPGEPDSLRIRDELDPNIPSLLEDRGLSRPNKPDTEAEVGSAFRKLPTFRSNDEKTLSSIRLQTFGRLKVALAGLEPARPYGQKILNFPRLPLRQRAEYGLVTTTLTLATSPGPKSQRLTFPTKCGFVLIGPLSGYFNRRYPGPS